MNHLLADETISQGARRSKNPSDHTWQCPTCGKVPPLLLPTGWYVRRPCACQRRVWQEQEQRQLPRTLDEALRQAQREQTYIWLGREWADEGLHQQTFVTFDRAQQPKAYDLAHQFSLAPSGVLALYGSYGLGKTHLLAAIANTRNDAGDCCLFASAVTLFDAIQQRISRDEDYSGLLRRAISTPLLLLDDVDKPKPSEFRQEMYYQIIDGRSRTGRPLVISFNCALMEVGRWIGGAARSRLFIGLTPVHLMGDDYRMSMH
jgi:DNA replication protein DnaC